MIPENPGWSVMDAEGNWVGYDVEVAKLLAQELGVELELIPTEGGNRVTMVQTDKCDVVISSFTPTLDRAKVITFSNPYGAAGTLPLCRKDNVFTSWEELSDKKIACARGSTNDILATNEFRMPRSCATTPSPTPLSLSRPARPTYCLKMIRRCTLWWQKTTT